MPHSYLIDIVGTCNLRCPTCPTGNMRQESPSSEAVVPIGFMPLSRYEAILQKIAVECGGVETRIVLYNWGEPLLHPEIEKIISLTNQYKNFRCILSSNLSHEKVNLGGIVRANPFSMRISLSGYHQKNYGISHRRGQIDLVKSNMWRLRHELSKQESNMLVHVAYHIYRHNAGDDLESMSRLCHDLEFRFFPFWAGFFPLEKFIRRIVDGVTSEEDERIIDVLAISPEERHEAAQGYLDEPCTLQTDQTVINFDGSVQLCCSTFERGNVIARDFLDTEPNSRLQLKQEHNTCDKCMAGGFHAVMLGKGIESVERAANRRLAEAGSRYELRGDRQLRKRRILDRLYGRLSAEMGRRSEV